MITVKSGAETVCPECGSHPADSFTLDMRPECEILAGHLVLKSVIDEIAGFTSAPGIEIPECECIIWVMEKRAVKADLLVPDDIESRSRRIFLLIDIRCSGNYRRRLFV